jgi:hypothetical protein
MDCLPLAYATHERYNYTLAGVGPSSYHLGGNFFQDEDGTLAWVAQSYIKKKLSNYIQLLVTPLYLHLLKKRIIRNLTAHQS